LIAKVDDKAIGCVQIAISKPVGRVEMLGIRSDITNTTRAKVVKMLLLVARQTLLKAGVLYASAMIPFELKSYKKLLKRRGGRNFGAGNIFIWEL